MRRANHIKAYVFDAYGTLFDFASAAKACVDEIDVDSAKLTALWRDKQLQYTWLRAAQGRHADFWRVTSDALDFTLETLGIANAALHSRLMDLYLTLPPFPDVRMALSRIKKRNVTTAILSNGAPHMLASAVAGGNLEGLFKMVISVEEVGVFKPHPHVYGHACERLGVPAEQIGFVSSNAWDVQAAAAFGMQTVWCNRSHQPRERLPGKCDHEVTTLADLPQLLEN